MSDELKKEDEEWKPIGYENFGKYYEISNYGNIRTIRGKKLGMKNNNGYLTVNLYKPYLYTATVSRLVAYTFIPNPIPLINDKVNHIDENKHNNYYKNLEWVTQKENVNKQTKDTRHKKRVIQLNIDGTHINIFETINDAAKHIGLDRTTISKVIVGVNQTAGGYKWIYEDDKKRPENREVVNLENAIDVKCLSFLDENLKNYYAFRDGRIYNKASNLFLKPCLNAKGASYVTLPLQNKKKNFYVHQLIGHSFIPNPDNKKRLFHIDGIKNNNSSDNLKWWY